MRKIPSEYENPIDDIIIEIGDNLSSHFKSIEFTANDLTSISFIMGLISVYNIYHNNYTVAAISYFISYMFDCFDGHYARKYNITSEFGDKYDHYKDMVINILVLTLLYAKIQKHKTSLMIIVVVLFALMMMHIGCQEKYYDSTSVNDNFLSHTKQFCPNKKMISYTRFFGTGTYNLMIAVLIWNLAKFT